jgi:hypothetical protein
MYHGGGRGRHPSGDLGGGREGESVSREGLALRRLARGGGALAAADRGGEVDHQRDRGTVVELLPAAQGLPGTEVDREA